MTTAQHRYRDLLSKGNKVHMARDLGIARQTIYDWISGKYEPNRKQLVTLSLYFKIPIDQII